MLEPTQTRELHAQLLQLRPLYAALLIIGGQIGLPLLVITYFFSKNVRRHPTLVNFWFTWIIYSVAFSLMVYANELPSQIWIPPSTICRVQAAMVHGAPPMCAVAAVQVVLQAWISFREMFATKGLFHSQSLGKWGQRLQMAATLSIPYIVFFAFSLASGIAATTGSNVHRLNNANGLYCTLRIPAFGQFGIPIFCSVMLLLLIAIQFIISFQYIRHWRHTSKLFPLAERRWSRSLIIRILLFNAYSIVVFGAGVIFLSNQLSTWPFMVQAALPLVAFCFFGSQKDMVSAWCFWKSAAPGPALSRLPSHELLVKSNKSVSSPSMSSTRHFPVSGSLEAV